MTDEKGIIYWLKDSDPSFYHRIHQMLKGFSLKYSDSFAQKRPNLAFLALIVESINVLLKHSNKRDLTQDEHDNIKEIIWSGDESFPTDEIIRCNAIDQSQLINMLHTAFYALKVAVEYQPITVHRYQHQDSKQQIAKSREIIEQAIADVKETGLSDFGMLALLSNQGLEHAKSGLQPIDLIHSFLERLVKYLEEVVELQDESEELWRFR